MEFFLLLLFTLDYKTNNAINDLFLKFDKIKMFTRRARQT